MSSHYPIHFADTYWEGGALRSREFEDIYFSSDGGRRESEEVYLEGNDLPNRFSNSDRFVVGELGFGTGLNFALTLELWKKLSASSSTLFYIAYERSPLKNVQVQEALHSQGINSELISEIVQILPLPIQTIHIIDLPKYRTRLILNYGEALEMLKETSADVDAWYLDGFTPSKNPALWSNEVVEEVSRLSHSTSTASTYTVSGTVRDILRKHGWQTEKVPGAGQKKEILRARFDGRRKSATRVTNPKVCIIGGGLCGAALVRSFSRRGAEITLIESRSELAQAASGNKLSVVLPYPSRIRDLPSRLYTTSFLYLSSLLDDLRIRRDGVLFHPLKDRKGGFFEDYLRHELPKEFAQVVPPDDASDLAGVKISKTNLFFPAACSLSFPLLIHRLIESSVSTQLNKRVTSIAEIKDDYDLIIIATGASFDLLPRRFLDILYPLKGEVGLVEETQLSKKLRVPVCDRGVVCPSSEGVHLVGSTYERGVSDESLSDTGCEVLGSVFNCLFPSQSVTFKSRRASVRASCKDRMPIVGDISREYDGGKIFITTAHGSRGGVTALLSGEVLAAEYYREPSPVELSVRNRIGVTRITSK